MRKAGLWICIALFFGRVLGQALTAIYAPPGLPPMEAWYSGLVPYPVLLPIQISLLMFLSLVAYDHSRGEGRLLQRTRRVSKALRSAAFLYAGVMIARYLVATTFGDTPHWYSGGLIPVTFHLVLATFLYLAGSSGRSVRPWPISSIPTSPVSSTAGPRRKAGRTSSWSTWTASASTRTATGRPWESRND
jgi:hypothetical protein